MMKPCVRGGGEARWENRGQMLRLGLLGEEEKRRQACGGKVN